MNKNRMLSTDGETNCTTRPEEEVKRQEIDWLAKRKYTRMIDQFPRKSVFYFG